MVTMGVYRTIFSVLVSIVIAQHVAAHSCDSGQRVVCMDVQSTASAPSTYGQYYDAHGYPLCTPAGEKVFCLVEHDYHRCGSGQVPCCADGSKPRHRGHGSGSASGEDVVCTPKGTAPVVTARARSKFQVILDDSSVAPHKMTNAFAGSYEPCMKDAYKGQFHHDWSKNKGSATFSYRFEPPESGCYFIEEYHPGGDEMCARYLPSNAVLDINYCSSKQKRFHIDQGSNGAQWNPVGKLPFDKGRSYDFTMRNHNAEQCRAPPCFWVADAFRLTLMGDRCSSDGKLMMQARLGHASTEASVLFEMKEHKSVLQATLATHLGYDAVTVLDITAVGRRLGEGHGFVKLAASLLVFGTPRAETTDLGQALQKGLSDAGAGLQIEAAEIDWSPEDLPVGEPDVGWFEDSDDGSRHLLIILICSGIAAFLTAMLSGFLLWRCYKKRASSNKKLCPVTPEVVKDLEGVAAKKSEENLKVEVVKDVMDVKDFKDENADCEIESVSTATPVSSLPLRDRKSVV